MESTPQGREEDTMPLPLTAILIEHDDHWTGWIADLPEVEHSAPTAAAVVAALPALALRALARREPDLILHSQDAERPRRPSKGPIRPPLQVHRRNLRRGFGWRRVTPRLTLCRSIRVQRSSRRERGQKEPDEKTHSH